MRQAFLTVRWRLLLGLVALAASVFLTLPTAISRDNLAGKVADIWPNGTPTVDSITGDTPLVGDIWPNGTAWTDNPGASD